MLNKRSLTIPFLNEHVPSMDRYVLIRVDLICNQQIKCPYNFIREIALKM